MSAVGEYADGFANTALKTVAVLVDPLYEVFVDESLRQRWLPESDPDVEPVQANWPTGQSASDEFRRARQL